MDENKEYLDEAVHFDCKTAKDGLPVTELTVQDAPDPKVQQPPANPFYRPKAEEGVASQAETIRLILPLVEGQAELRLPNKMSEASARDLKTWMDLMVAQTLRMAGVNPQK